MAEELVQEQKKKKREDFNLSDKQKNLLDRIKNEGHRIAHLVGFEKFNELHAKWIQNMWKSDDIYVLKASRGSYKSSVLTLFIALLILCKPNKTIIFMRKTDNDVKEIVEKVSKILHTPQFQAFSQILYGHGYNFTKDTAFEINTTLKSDLGGKSQLIALGSSGSLTGKHSDYIIVDDLCNIKDRTSHAERERIKLVWMELQNVRNRGGRTIAVGTNWHCQDVFSLMPPADIYTCYDCCKYGIMTMKEIENLKKTMTPALFAANYELKFIANEDAIFTDIRYLKPSGMTEQEIKDGVNPKDLLDGCLAHLDASYGGDDTTALTLMKKLSDGRIIAYGKVWDKHVKHCMNDITMLCNFYNYRTLWMETNGDKGYLAQEFRQRGMKVMTYHEKMNKDVKIQTYLYGAWQDIYWLEETDPNYVNQVMDYTENAEIVDAPDSGACACRLLNKGKIKSLSGFDYI